MNFRNTPKHRFIWCNRGCNFRTVFYINIYIFKYIFVEFLIQIIMRNDYWLDNYILNLWKLFYIQFKSLVQYTCYLCQIPIRTEHMISSTTENEKLWMMQHNVFQNHLCSSKVFSWSYCCWKFNTCIYHNIIFHLDNLEFFCTCFIS